MHSDLYMITRGWIDFCKSLSKSHIEQEVPHCAGLSCGATLCSCGWTWSTPRIAACFHLRTSSIEAAVRQMAKVLFAENVHGTITLSDNHLEWRWLKDTMSLSQVILHTSFVLEKSTTRFYCASHRRASLMLVLNVSFYRALMNRLHAVRTLLMGCREAWKKNKNQWRNVYLLNTLCFILRWLLKEASFLYWLLQYWQLTARACCWCWCLMCLVIVPLWIHFSQYSHWTFPDSRSKHFCYIVLLTIWNHFVWYMPCELRRWYFQEAAFLRTFPQPSISHTTSLFVPCTSFMCLLKFTTLFEQISHQLLRPKTEESRHLDNIYLLW